MKNKILFNLNYKKFLKFIKYINGIIIFNDMHFEIDFSIQINLM